MGDVNKHGLDRDMGAELRREIRQRCGFGCVVCGSAFYDYEHFNPDFCDATEHVAEGITLLCMQCNQKRRRKLLSRETVANKNKDPMCRRDGFSSEVFDFGTDPIEVYVAGNKFKHVDTLIMLGGCEVLSVAEPVNAGEPFRLSGFFSDRTGATTLEIEENVVRVGAGNWDVENRGARITIRKQLRDISLVLFLEPPNRITVERIDMQCEGRYLKGDSKGLMFSKDGRNWHHLALMEIQYARVGISVG